MLTDEQTQRLLCMQMLTVEAGNSIPSEEVYAVWAWAENILEARRRLAAKEVPPGAWSKEEALAAAYQRLTEVLEGRAGVHVVDGKVCLCPLEDIPAERLKLFQQSLPQIVHGRSRQQNPPREG